jgi:hypothetical protein
MGLLIAFALPLLAVGTVLVYAWQALDARGWRHRGACVYPAARGSRCPRCHQPGTHSRCPRCALKVRRVMVTIAAAGRTLAVVPGGSRVPLICHRLTLTDGRRLELIGPAGLVFPPGEQALFILDGTGRVRAVEIAVLHTGWTLGLRAHGARSPLALIGGVLLVVGSLIAIEAALGLALLWRTHWVMRLLGASGLDEGAIAASFAVGVALCALGAALTLRRARPKLNRGLATALLAGG